MPKTPGPPRLRSFYLPLKRRALSLAHAAQTSVLTSWKEIAQYIGKGARSAQRWERELGFLVRRMQHGRKSSVLAVPAEIDAWLQSQRLFGEQSCPEEPERTTLLRTLNALRAENRKLRRQLALERAKRC
jgi:hypothetical protein